MRPDIARLTAIERELRGAIAADAIDVHYQPLVHLDARRIVGFEALVRWRSRALGPIKPEEFIPFAEETGLIHRLGAQLLRRTCLEATQWPKDIVLAFNISAVQLRSPGFGLQVMRTLADTGLPPAQLELDISERAFSGEDAVMEQSIDALHDAGVHIALDHFGTGYVQRSQLRSLRVGKIKIDRSLIARLGAAADSKTTVRAIVELAKSLDLATGAVAIETEKQLAVLRSEGCTLGQGDLFGNAIPATEVTALLRNPPLAVAAA